MGLKNRPLCNGLYLDRCRIQQQGGARGPKIAAWRRAMNGPTGTLDKSETNDFAVEREARSLYWRGLNISAIARELGVPRPTVASWQKRGEWRKAQSVQIIEDRLEVKAAALIDRGEKITEGEMKRVDFFLRCLER
ncbi:MAG TPA: helix-turn-helix domain-containing protein, partial [Sphingopyxis sp.]|nr:helix-turn-helix domain-containing protein [Sphingopyxis sp.]